ncbi:MAG TPA: threonine synthase [Hyphomonadaceae bacterium]|jgi:threonine synthase|nr:threonine synthase [Hyphomonadaceae bacterium]
MKYVSTRGNAEPADFVSASLLGLAPDGGLFVPTEYPQIERPSASATYVETATRILSAFAGNSIPEAAIRSMAERAYAPFAHQSVAPLVQVGQGRWMMELHHGPTLAFKDVAMRLIAQLYDHILGARGERMTILCATSGDTGGAAAAAFAGSKHVDMVILHPHNRVSPVQRLFMTATGASNVHNFGLEGDFDGTQAILKQLLADEQFRRRSHLAAVNSINWTRVAAQSVYFAQAQAQLGADQPIRFVVPTGNFGDALAAYVASRCGLLNRFEVVSAVNENDAMARLISGMPLMKGATKPTISPAMDIQLPSNFERLLFEASGRDGAAVASAYAMLASKGEAPLPKAAVAKFSGIGLSAERVSDIETAEEMKRTYAETGWVVCPHTAVGLAAARRNRTADGPVVTLATAHAAKFPETVEQVLGLKVGLPDRARQFATRKEQFDTGPMDAGFVRDRIDAIVKSH